jgi:hypothetical protein
LQVRERPNGRVLRPSALLAVISRMDGPAKDG